MTSTDEQITVKGSNLPHKHLHFGLTHQSFFILHWENTELRKARLKNRASLTDWKKNRKDRISTKWNSKAHVWFGFITFKTSFFFFFFGQAVPSLWWCRYCQHRRWKGFVIKLAQQPEDFSKQLLNQCIWVLVLGVNVCGLGRSSCLLGQRRRASALWAGVNKRRNGALGNRLKWAMRQVCAEASNESFAGNFRFLWAKERWGRRQERKTSWKQERIIYHSKEKKFREPQLSEVW